MGDENVAAFSAADAGEAALMPLAEAVGPSFAAVTPADLARRLGSLVSEVDRPALGGEAARWLAEVFQASVHNGPWGWYDDELALVAPWGFEVDAIRGPVAVWQGGQDRMTPFAHGEWLASHLPGAHAHLLPDEGHLSLGVDSFGLILDDLLATVRPEPTPSGPSRAREHRSRLSLFGREPAHPPSNGRSPRPAYHGQKGRSWSSVCSYPLTPRPVMRYQATCKPMAMPPGRHRPGSEPCDSLLHHRLALSLRPGRKASRQAASQDVPMLKVVGRHPKGRTA